MALKGPVGGLPNVWLAGALVASGGKMRRVERQVTKPWTAALAVAPNEIDGGVGKNIGRVFALAMKFRNAAMEVVFLTIVVMIIIEIAGGVADEFVESALGRPRTFGETDVPFAKATGRVGHRRALQDLRN